jgi:Na+-translocating ferredoxin:NAD+ oxidoreductase RnfD subunit
LKGISIAKRRQEHNNHNNNNDVGDLIVTFTLDFNSIFLFPFFARYYDFFSFQCNKRKKNFHLTFNDLLVLALITVVVVAAAVTYNMILCCCLFVCLRLGRNCNFRLVVNSE